MSRHIPILTCALAGACLAGGLLAFRSQSPDTPNSIERTELVKASNIPLPEPEPEPLIADIVPPAAETSATATAAVPAPDSNSDLSKNDSSSTGGISHSPATAGVAPSQVSGASESPSFGHDLEVEVPPGAPLPISLIPALPDNLAAAELSEAQQRVTDQVAEDFVRQVDAASPAPPNDTERLNNWRSAVANADERLRWLLGQDTYNREVIRQNLTNKKTPTTN